MGHLLRLFGNQAPITLPAVSVDPIYVRAGRKIVSGYSGMAAKNAAGADLSFADVAALSSVTALSQIYDQSGFGNHPTQATSAVRPEFAPVAKIKGIPVLAFGLNSSGASKYFDIPSGVSIDRQDMTMIDVVWPNGYLQQSSYWQLGSTLATPNIGAFQEASPVGYSITPATTVRGAVVRSQPQMIAFVSSASEQRIYARETSTSAAARTSSVATGGFDGYALGTGYKNYHRSLCRIIYPKALNSTEIASIFRNLALIYGIETSFTTRYIFDGDSLMISTEAAYQQLSSIPNSIVWPAAYERFNAGIAGQQLSTATTNFATRFNSLMISGVGNITFIEACGINDLYIGGVTDATLAARDDAQLAAIRARAAAQGITVRALIATISPTAASGWTGTMETYRQSANTRRRSLVGGGGQTWDGCVDVDQVITSNGITPANTTYYTPDALHWKDALISIIAAQAYQPWII